MSHPLPRLACLLFLVLFGSTDALLASPKSSETTQLNDGYSLLYQVSDDESNVSMLFLVKSAPSEISDFGKRMSETAHDTIEALEQLQNHDAALQFDRHPLPPIEKDVRASIDDDKEHQLLYGTKGPAFVQAFLIIQIEASNYAANLSKVLAEQETNAHRSSILQHISASWLARREEAFRLLRNY